MGDRRRWELLALVALLGTVGCQGGEPAAPAVPAIRVENPRVGVAIAALPELWKVAVNEGANLELVPAAEGSTGHLEIVASEPEVGGINLVAALEEHKAEIEGREAGEYRGQRELGTQLGTAFYSRGHWQEEGRQVEETTVFLVHPWGDRKLMLVYRYPQGDADDTRMRIEEHLFSLLSELEGVGGADGGDA